MVGSAPETQRIDQWLWHARFFKTRGLATRVVAAGHVRADGARVAKPSFSVRAGMTLTFPQGNAVRVVRVLSLAGRRGPASEAQALYSDHSPQADPQPANPAYEGRGRPTGKERRALGRTLSDPLD